MTKLIYVPLLCLSLLAGDCAGLTSTQVSQVIRKARKVVGPAKPAMLRLTFHDCVGGCDGCLNVADPDNAGLEALVAGLEEIYQSEELGEVLSRADLWALLGVWAVQQTIDNSNEDCEDCDTGPDQTLDFKWGRVDCDTAPYSDSLLNYPSGLLNHDELMSFFDSEFGYTEREVTALMGAHTLGAADIFNSGFNGVWVNDEQQYFNNKYYSHLTDDSINWRLVKRSCRRLNSVDTELCEEEQTTGWQWTASGVGFNLNADMALVKDFETDAEGQPSCQFSECPDSSSASIAKEFAESNALFIEEFSAIYSKLFSTGYDSLQSLE